MWMLATSDVQYLSNIFFFFCAELKTINKIYSSHLIEECVQQRVQLIYMLKRFLGKFVLTQINVFSFFFTYFDHINLKVIASF